MTTAEMVEAFKTGYDIWAQGIAPGYEDEEIDRRLNMAQMFLINKSVREGNLGALSPLIIQDTSLTVAQHPTLYNDGAGIETKRHWYYADVDYTTLGSVYILQPLSLETRITRVGFKTISTPTFVPCDILDANMAAKIKGGAFDAAFYEQPKAFLTNGSDGDKDIMIIADYETTVLTDALMDYVRYPADINSDTAPTAECELEELYHQQIVDMAIKLAQTPTEPQKAAANVQVSERLKNP